MLFNFGEKKKDEFYLDEVIQGIGESVARAKIGIDIVAIKTRRESQKYDEIMKVLPFITFKISDVEIDLKFMVTKLEEIQDPCKSQDSQNSMNAKDGISMDDSNNDENDDSIVQSLKKRVVVNMDINELAKTDPSIICKIAYKMTQNTISEYAVNGKKLVLEHADKYN